MHSYVPVMSLSSNDMLASISRADKGKARFEKEREKERGEEDQMSKEKRQKEKCGREVKKGKMRRIKWCGYKK